MAKLFDRRATLQVVRRVSSVEPFRLAFLHLFRCGAVCAPGCGLGESMLVWTRMFVSVSQAVVLAFGIVICVLCAWGLYAPEKLIKFVLEVVDRDYGLYAAVIVRVLLGIALIVASAESSFPLVFEALGWIAIVAAIAIAILGRPGLRRLAGWFNRFSPTVVRVWLLFGIAFGGCLIYGV